MKRTALLGLILLAAPAWGRHHHPTQRRRPSHSITGFATVYADRFHGRLTSSGERFSQGRSSCASRHAAFRGRTLRVTNLGNGRTALIPCNDTGGYGVVDLSKAAMRGLGGKGKIRVRVEVAR